MNVYFIQDIDLILNNDGSYNDVEYDPNDSDWSVYDDCFDHIQYDVAQLDEYAPQEYDVQHSQYDSYGG